MALILWAMARPAQPDIDLGTYAVPSAIRSEEERAALQAELARQRQLEEARSRREQEEQARRLAEALARHQARPYPERLTEQRCTACHTEQHYAQAGGHSWIGWAAVIWRMRLLNRAPLSWSEIWIIADHLAKTYPATGVRLWLEWGSAALGLGLPLGYLLWRRRRPPSQTLTNRQALRK